MSDPKVCDVMTRSVVTVSPDETIADAARRLASHGISGAPVTREGKVIGMITESDIVRAALPPLPSRGGATPLEVLNRAGEVGQRPATKSVAEAMSTLVVEVSPEDDVWQAAAEMEQRGVNRIPVVDEDGTVVGILTRADLVKLIAQRAL